jgi:4-phytase/acid phosphatase
MELFGAYDRAYLAEAGLLGPTGCADVGHVYFRVDSEERMHETGGALAQGLFPGCPVEVHSLPEKTHDPLFSPIAVGIGHPDRTLAVAAVMGRIGGDPKALQDLYQPQLETLARVLLECKPEAKCPPRDQPAKQSLLEGPTSVGPGKGDHLADLEGPLRIASSLAEDILLEYANGMTGEDLGWGGVDESKVRELMALHAVYADLLRQTHYISSAQASNLLSHILKTMQQAREGKAIPGALGELGDRVVVIVGHDTNISNMAGTLGLSWLIEGYQKDDTPPGGALVFELWREPTSGDYTVRTYYMTQTLDQMRRALPLTLASPPAKAPVFLPGCSTAREGLTCRWEAFEHTIEASIDSGFVSP